MAFKIATDPFVGRLTFIRVYTGTLESGSYVLNASKDTHVNVLVVCFKCTLTSRTEIPEVFSGDIAAAIGLKNTTTGDSLTDVDHPLDSWNQFGSSRSSYPSIQSNLNLKADQDKMDVALQKLTEEDPTFRAETNPETGRNFDRRYG